MKQLIALPLRTPRPITRNPFDEPRPVPRRATPSAPALGAPDSLPSSAPATPLVQPLVPNALTPVRPELTAVRLAGIVTGHPSVAVLEIRESAQRRTRILRAGQAVTEGREGMVLARIEADRIHLKTADGMQILRVGESSPGGDAIAKTNERGAASAGPAASDSGSAVSAPAPGAR